MARMQGKTTSDTSQLFAGIDVSKAHLDLQLSCERRSRRFANDPAGFAAIDAHLRARGYAVPGRAGADRALSFPGLAGAA